MVRSKVIESFSTLILNPNEDPGDFFCKDGLDIYRKNYLFSLISSLKNKYPSILKILGSRNFNYFAKIFIYAHPSTSPNIDNYGNGLGQFLGKRKELNDLGYLEELAKLDIFWFQAVEDSSLELSKGVLSLWKSLQQGVSEEVLIDEEERETIQIVKMDDELHFKTNHFFTIN